MKCSQKTAFFIEKQFGELAREELLFNKKERKRISFDDLAKQRRAVRIKSEANNPGISTSGFKRKSHLMMAFSFSGEPPKQVVRFPDHR